MKLLTSSPSISSSSSTITVHFDANMCSSRSATASCLAGILRRILCSRSLPTHPSDYITETSSIVCENKHQESNEETKASSATTQGVVARLMGLEPFHDTTRAGATSITRSRSINSVEFRGESDQTQGNCKRVQSTLSLREMPTFFEQENDEFFVLRFEDDGDSKQFGPRCKVSCKDLKQKRREKSRSKEQRREKVALEKKEHKERIKKMVLSVLIDEELRHGRKMEDWSRNPTLMGFCEQPNAVEEQKKANSTYPKEASLRKKNKKRNDCAFKEELECSPQDSSPVSVLDFNQFMNDHEVPTSEEDTKSGDSNSSSKLSSKPDEDNSLDNNLMNINENSERTEKTCHGLRSSHDIKDHTKLWAEICRLAEADEVTESNWVHKRVLEFKDFDDICADLGLRVLDQLLEELVDQTFS